MDATAEVEADAPGVETPIGSGTILLVADEEALRKLTSASLSMLGYTVLEAAQGRETIEICREHQGPISVMVTHVVMPGMSGRDLAERVARMRPETNVLYVSGYTGEAISHHRVMETGTAVLQKPFTR